MLIRYTKGKNRTYTLTCVRDDGSRTWSTYPASSNFAQHDIVHYAVETTLGYRQAFYGLLARGQDIRSFGQRDKTTRRKTAVPLQAVQTEFLVNLFQTELWDKLVDPDFLTTLSTACAHHDVPVPGGITSEQLDLVRRKIGTLLQQWADLPTGESLEVTF